MLPFFNWSEDEWVEVGPGSKECLRKMFGPAMANHANALWAMRYLRDQQFAWYVHIGAQRHEIPRLYPNRAAGLTMVDIEHSLCECEKYSRGLGGLNIEGRRSKIGKRQFVPHDAPPSAVLPPHWLEPGYVPTLTRPAPVSDDGAYEVSHIVSERDDGRMFHVRWLGWGIEDDTWEPREEIERGSPVLVEQWDNMKQRIAAALEEQMRAKAVQIDRARRARRSTRRTTT